MIDPETRLRIRYPATNHVGFDPPLLRRAVLVRRVRDLVREPLSIEEFLRRPFIRRSRWLLSGVDEESGKCRQFYLGSSLEFRSPGLVRVALYEPAGNRPYEILTRGFEPTPEDRKKLMRVLRAWSAKDVGELQICVYSDDMRLVS